MHACCGVEKTGRGFIGGVCLSKHSGRYDTSGFWELPPYNVQYFRQELLNILCIKYLTIYYLLG